MEVKNGRYTKFGIGNETILAFVENSKFDNYHLIYSLIGNGRGYSHQSCEKDEENKYFNKVAYIQYTFGKDPKPIDAIILDFDFDNQKLRINNKVYNVKDDKKYTYKFLKRTLKVNGGLEGFYKFIVREMHDRTYLQLIDVLKNLSV